jgi:acyl-CoA thioester hydrolase
LYTAGVTDSTGRPFLTEIRFRVQTYDIDFAGIVSNQVYIRWLEDLRLKLLEEHWPLERQLAAGYLPVLLSTEIRYLRALRLFDRPDGRMWLPDLGRVRWRLEAEFVCDGSPVATARHICAFVRADTMKPVPVPLGMREAFDRSEKRG